jgi:hypothetical protein
LKNHIEDALRAWREAERKIHGADGKVTPEMSHELVEAMARYREMARAAPASEDTQSDDRGSYPA